jgi:peptidoglycan/xylan/chitin deacetylase (PgdA/CDA1 family)
LYQPLSFIGDSNFSETYIKSNNTKIDLLFRNDDLSDKTDLRKESKVLHTLNNYGIKPIYSVIPALNNRVLTKKDAVIDSLRLWNMEGKIYLALHGYSHIKNKFNAGEFKGKPYSEQYKDIKKGKAILDSLLYSDIKMFCPPWDQGDKNTVLACNKAGLTVYSGYLYASSVKNEIFFGATNNLFDGPLSSLKNALKYASEKKDGMILLSLFHSSYDYNEDGNSNLDSILSYIKTIPNVKYSSPDSVVSNSHNILNKINNVYGHNIVKGEMLAEKSTIMKMIARLFRIKVAEKMDKDLTTFQAAIWSNDDLKLNKTSLAMLETGRNIFVSQRVLFSFLSVIMIVLFYRNKNKHVKIFLLLLWFLLILTVGYAFSGFSTLEIQKWNDLILFIGVLCGSLTIAYFDKVKSL